VRRAALALLPLAVAAASLDSIAPFSAAPPGAALPSGWRVVALARRATPEFALVSEGAATVLRVKASAAAGSAVHALAADTQAAPMLAWRWKVDHALEKARLGTREGDDFAARVYVSFDVPLETLGFTERAKVRLARLFYGADLPAAAICYVWDNLQPIGTRVWNPYAVGRVAMIVVESGNAHAGEWIAEARDVEADFESAFGAAWKKRAPRISGVAVSADTDQTGESVTAWFSDLRLAPRR
jgi:hypothetical protein